MTVLPIEEYFKYHPPTTIERQQKHNIINAIALEFARILDISVIDEDCKNSAGANVLQSGYYS
jgi:hypothetical protein